MTQTHIDVAEYIQSRGILPEWRPDVNEWPTVLAMIDSGLISAERHFPGYNDWPEGLHKVYLTTPGFKALERWKSEAYARSTKGRLWGLTSRFTLWLGVLIGGGIATAFNLFIGQVVAKVAPTPSQEQSRPANPSIDTSVPQKR